MLQLYYSANILYDKIVLTNRRVNLFYKINLISCNLDKIRLVLSNSSLIAVYVYKQIFP